MNKYLIVVDMQKDFIDGALGTPEAQAIIPNVIDKIKNFDGDHVFCTLDTHKHYGLLPAVEEQRVPEHCLYSEENWYFPSEIEDALNDQDYTTIMKYTFGFNSWYHLLGDWGGYNNYEDYYTTKMDITIIGLCTDICVITNALMLRSLFPCAHITVDSSCCAGTTPEAHAAALQVMKSCCIDII